MSFDFEKFMAGMSKILPAIGETVIALHPGNVNEALKIRVGTQLITAVADTLHESATSAPTTSDAAPGNGATTQ